MTLNAKTVMPDLQRYPGNPNLMKNKKYTVVLFIRKVIHSNDSSIEFY